MVFASTDSLSCFECGDIGQLKRAFARTKKRVKTSPERPFRV